MPYFYFSRLHLSTRLYGNHLRMKRIPARNKRTTQRWPRGNDGLMTPRIVHFLYKSTYLCMWFQTNKLYIVFKARQLFSTRSLKKQILHYNSKGTTLLLYFNLTI